MDDTGAIIAPKSAAGIRKVPIAAVLRDLLIEHRLASGRSDDTAARMAHTGYRHRGDYVLRSGACAPSAQGKRAAQNDCVRAPSRHSL
jgi:hypothetical protein